MNSSIHISIIVKVCAFLQCCFTVGTMDEVLASLQRGQIQLRKVPAQKTAPPVVDLRSNLMSAIRQGVTLKKVRCSSRTENMPKYSLILFRYQFINQLRFRVEKCQSGSFKNTSFFIQECRQHDFSTVKRCADYVSWSESLKKLI